MVKNTGGVDVAMPENSVHTCHLYLQMYVCMHLVMHVHNKVHLYLTSTNVCISVYFYTINIRTHTNKHELRMQATSKGDAGGKLLLKVLDEAILFDQSLLDALPML